jgi:hypothetical protein
MKSIFSKLLKKNKEQRNANHFFEEETNKKENLHRELNYSKKVIFLPSVPYKNQPSNLI